MPERVTYNTDELRRAAANRTARDRITVKDQSPSVKVILDRRWQITQSFIQNQIGGRDPDNITWEQMRVMRRHPMVAFGIHFIKAVLGNADWHIDGSVPRVNAFTDHALRRVYPSYVKQMSTALEFGHAPIVDRFETVDYKWMFTDPAGREQKVWNPPVPVAPLVWKQPRLLPIGSGTEPRFLEDEETFNGIKCSYLSRTTKSTEPLIIDRQHSLWFTNELDESRNNWYGYPRTGYIFDDWYDARYRRLLESRHFEQDADPPLVVRVPEGSSPDPFNPGQEIDNRELGLLIGMSLRDGATIVMDSATYIDEATGRPTSTFMWDANFLRGGENMGAFRQSAQDLDIGILRGLFIPDSAILQNTGTHTGRVVEAYGAAFVASQAMLMDDIDRAFNEIEIPKVVNQNFTGSPDVRKVTTGFKSEDITLANDLLKIIVSQAPQYLQIDWRKVVASVGLPLLSLEEQQALVAQIGPMPKAGSFGSTNGAEPADAGDAGNQAQGKNKGDTGGVGGASQPQNVSRRAALAAALGESAAEELLDLNQQEKIIVERINAVFEVDGD